MSERNIASRGTPGLRISDSDAKIRAIACSRVSEPSSSEYQFATTDLCSEKRCRHPPRAAERGSWRFLVRVLQIRESPPMGHRSFCMYLFNDSREAHPLACHARLGTPAWTAWLAGRLFSPGMHRENQHLMNGTVTGTSTARAISSKLVSRGQPPDMDTELANDALRYTFRAQQDHNLQADRRPVCASRCPQTWTAGAALQKIEGVHLRLLFCIGQER